MLKVESLQKTYPGRRGDPPVKAVDSVTFQVKEGELVGLLGPNGAGKTTIVKMICGLIRPDQGQVLINGFNMTSARSSALENISAVLEGNRNLYWRLTVRENLEFFAALKGKNPKTLTSDMEKYIDFFRLEEKINVEARKLSRGMQQKLSIAVAMIANSPILVLDEPTLGLDVQASNEIRVLLKRAVAEEGRTIILTTHDMSVVQDTCERAVIISDGRMIADDKVHNFLELFKAKVYQIRIRGHLTETQRLALLSMNEVAVESESHEGTVLSVRLEDPKILYDVFAVLGQENSFIESIDRQANNLERVFLEILRRSGGGGQETAVI